MTQAPVWSDESRPRRQPRVAEQRAHDALVLLDLDSGRYYTLEGSGDRIWALCDGEHRLADIVSTMTATYGTDAARVRSDAIELLGRLAAEGLVDDAG